MFICNKYIFIYDNNDNNNNQIFFYNNNNQIFKNMCHLKINKLINK